ncbi:unnamed protein product [Mytilus edulis]|uniref:ISXO2-like transposase domain-containing protein n=1 Tax=Mytilus edulis TaxID=6550 RepID=A0A8S3UKM8_MYTED|nr:unnamed protein product [Mytilus edulis]
MEYRHTSVNWARCVRELFREHVHTEYQNLVFEGNVEKDESLFGRKITYNRGKPTGTRIWIFGMVEASSKRIIMYPVDKRDSHTLFPLIKKHILPGSRIFSDSWAAYIPLNKAGYEHFSVCHKTSFKQIYKNEDTGEYVKCCTNPVKGAWKLSKDHFRRINGTNTKQFEQHLAEIIWRKYASSNKRNYTYPSPLFPTWTPPVKEVENAHATTIVKGSDDESDDEAVSTTPPSSNIDSSTVMAPAGYASAFSSFNYNPPSSSTMDTAVASTSALQSYP